MRRRQINRVREAGILPPVAAHARERWPPEAAPVEPGRGTASPGVTGHRRSEMPDSSQARFGGGGGLRCGGRGFFSGHDFGGYAGFGSRTRLSSRTRFGGCAGFTGGSRFSRDSRYRAFVAKVRQDVIADQVAEQAKQGGNQPEYDRYPHDGLSIFEPIFGKLLPLLTTGFGGGNLAILAQHSDNNVSCQQLGGQA